MSDKNTPGRRDFLVQGSGTLVGAHGLLGSAVQANQPVSEPGPNHARSARPIPAHRSIRLPGLHSYAERSLNAGETIHFRTSSNVPYRLSLCRLEGDVDDPASDRVLQQVEVSEPLEQPISPGSYIHVEKGLSSKKQLKSLAIECWVRPWRLDQWQGILTQHDFPKACGLGLFLDHQGRISFYLGNGKAYDASRQSPGPALNHRRWNHVVCNWDGSTVSIWLNGRLGTTREFDGPVNSGSAPLRLGAYGQDGNADRFFEGDLAMPVIYHQALSADEIKARIDARGLSPPPAEKLAACWPLAEEKGDHVADIGVGKRHGQVINHATWMIGGPGFHGEKVGRYDVEYDPASDPRRGHGIRLAGDDLFDCRWKVTEQFRIPADAKSGVYVGRFEYKIEGRTYRYPVTFNVRRPPNRNPSRILVLLSSSTWAAYNSAFFPVPSGGQQFVTTLGMANCHPEAPAYSCYRDHQYGQPAYYFGTKVPCPAAAPDWMYLAPKMKYSHLLRGELFLHRWLDGHYRDHGGYAYDVVTDYDLHRDPDLLKEYATLIINGHSEYWSEPAYRGVERYLSKGGTVIALSGNTMFWRTSFNEDGSVMECRKYDSRIGGRGGASIGELYHSQDGKRGSLMRECGLPAWKCIGLDCCGWCGDTNGAYHTETPEHFLFSQPEKVGLARSETFGHAREGDYPMSVGHEWDVRLSTLRKMTRNIPPGAVLPEEPEGITTLALGKRSGGGLIIDYFTQPSAALDRNVAEMIYWERPEGGRVFHAGSIASGSVLAVDPKWQTVMRNVLHHFGVPARK